MIFHIKNTSKKKQKKKEESRQAPLYSIFMLLTTLLLYEYAQNRLKKKREGWKSFLYIYETNYQS